MQHRVSCRKDRRTFVGSACLGAAFLLLAGLWPISSAQAFDEISKTWFGGVAIDGYDTTAYWRGNAKEGQKIYSTTWKNAEWRFLSEADRDAFAVDPDRFVPRYGGHCANAMSLNELVDADGGIWRIFDGKLYLFAAEAGRERWDQGSVRELAARADANWQRFLGQ